MFCLVIPVTPDVLFCERFTVCFRAWSHPTASDFLFVLCMTNLPNFVLHMDLRSCNRTFLHILKIQTFLSWIMDRIKCCKYWENILNCVNMEFPITFSISSDNIFDKVTRSINLNQYLKVSFVTSFFFSVTYRSTICLLDIVQCTS